MEAPAVFGQKLGCVICGSTGGCGCWEKCSCGWIARNGFQCRNPETKRCSTKVNSKRIYTNRHYAKDTAHNRKRKVRSDEG